MGRKRRKHTVRKWALEEKDVKSCILHLDGHDNDTGPIQSFDKTTWGKVQYARLARLKTKNDSKYTSVCLKISEEFSDKDGYHTTCYKTFTAVPLLKTNEPCAPTSGNSVLRSDVIHPVSGTNEMFKDICVFCDVGRSGNSDNKSELTTCRDKKSERSLKETARKLSDAQMMAKIEAVDLVAKRLKYHSVCRKEYFDKLKKATCTSDDKENSYKHTRTSAFAKVKQHVEDHIIGALKVERLTSLYDRFLSYLYRDVCEDEQMVHTSYFGQTLMKEYPDQIRMSKQSNRRGNIIYSKDLSESDALKMAEKWSETVEADMENVALYFRSVILNLWNESDEMPYPLAADDIIKGQSELPPILLTFFHILLTGNTATPSERVMRYASSLTADCLNSCTRGLLKTSKHLCLGLGLKSLTGSRKIIEMMSKFGHCIGYQQVEKLETDLATSLEQKCQKTPDGIIAEPGLSTALAWDNYDEMNETLSGSGTLHDCVGICYQNISLRHTRRTATHDGPLPVDRKRRFTLEVDSQIELEPYRKKPKITGFNYEVKSVEKPDSLQIARKQDLLWSVMCTMYSDIPMWTGWNSTVIHDPLPKQYIGYMANIEFPPTRLDVVAETLRVSQKVAAECGEKYAIVHYDLAIAKPAKQIQQEESPTFDNVFICFGPFHIQMAFFASLGYIIDGSGGPHILTETDVLSSGSLNSFLSGKHYNRCKRLHMLTSLAFRSLHLQQFLLETGGIDDELKLAIDQARTGPTAEMVLQLDNLQSYNDFIQRYDAYCERTRLGKHGMTARFLMQYIDLVQLYFLFSRACHSNDLDLFIHCIGRLASIFFATNRPNYARWMVRYHLDLMNIDYTHLVLRQTLQNGALTIRRTSNDFSRSPVDLALEQSINAGAASRRTGIAAFSTNAGARHRWMVTYSSRMAILKALNQQAGVSNDHTDFVKELRTSRITRDNEDLRKLSDGIENRLNPFIEEFWNDNLYCLSTGKVVDVDIAQDIVSVEARGDSWMNEFTKQCFETPSRFEKPIKRQKVKSFSSAAITTTLKSSERTIKQLKSTRDLFGRLLCVATSTGVDLRKVFEYPLTAVPLSLAHVDGSMLKTNKCKLMQHLESQIVSKTPQRTDATIIDGMFLIQSLTNLPIFFGQIAQLILSRIAHLSRRVDFVCDTYSHPSIKDVERENRGTTSIEMAVSGADQHRPSDFHAALKNEVFKTKLLIFLAEEWAKAKYAKLLKCCTLYFGLEDSCLMYVSDGNTVTRTVHADLTCRHEEADTRIVWHIADVARTMANPYITVRASDTDVLVILLYHVNISSTRVTMDVGNSGQNNRRYIDVTTLADGLESEMCHALPGIHAFT